ncbi:cell wall hydrolase [Sphingomonas sp.]|uniref:cell wall hydrolase n=1 Tax=Sphingomonas sp. TaxID=28214 RepID=UPI003AFF731F
MRRALSSTRAVLRGWLVAALGLLGLSGAMATGAAWRALASHPATAAAAIIPVGYEAQDHFPGAAALYLADAPAPAPAGATGTIELPPLPVSAAQAQALVAAETGIVPARPFSTAAATGLDRGRALQCLADAIYYEAASEPDAGQRAVAQVILNRARHPAFPATVCGVVYQGSERGGCQFSFACDGAMARVPSRTAWTRAARVAAAALAGYVYAPVGLATHYHTYAVTPAWNRTLVMTDVVGAHFFHRWKGYWGTAAAFSQAYRGGEPVPGPHVPVVAPMAPAIAIAPSASGPTYSTIQPPFQASSVAAAAPTPDDRLPPAAPILDRWRDSGKPL